VRFLRSLDEGRRQSEPGIVDQEVEVISLPQGTQGVPKSADERRNSGDVAHVQRKCCGLPLLGFDLVYNLEGAALLAAVGDDHIGAAPCERKGGTAAETPTTSGYQGELVVS